MKQKEKEQKEEKRREEKRREEKRREEKRIEASDKRNAVANAFMRIYLSYVIS